MKKAIIAATLLLSVYSSFAQSEARQIETNIGLGVYPINRFSFDGIIDGSYAYTLDAKYYLTKKFAMGLGLGVWKFTYGNYRPQNYTTITACAEASIMYYNRYRVQFYGMLALGACYLDGFQSTNQSSHSIGVGSADNPTNKKVSPMVNIAPLGVRVGGTHGAYLELGFGYKGLLNGGYSLRLGSGRKAKTTAASDTPQQ